MTRYRWLLALGALFSAGAVLVCLTVPLYSGDDGSGVAGATLLEVNGLGVLLPLSLFVVLAVGAWLAPSRRVRVILAGGHAMLCLLALLSIGVLFLPATLLLLVGAVVDARAPAAARPQRPLVPSA